MGIHRLNHAVLYVRDLQASLAFYTGVLGFTQAMEAPMPGAAFLRAPDSENDHDLGLFQLGAGAGAATAAGRREAGLYHLAWEVDTLADLEELAVALRDAGALSGASDHGTTKSLYAQDPDGIELEIVWLIPADRINADDLDIRAVVHGDASTHVLTDEAYNRVMDVETGNPNTPILAELKKLGIHVELCDTRRKNEGWSKSDIHPDVLLASAAYARLIDLQHQGYAYIKF